MVVLLTQELAPLLADGGRVLNVSSGTTRTTLNTGLSVYGALKGAVFLLSLVLSASRAICVGYEDLCIEILRSARCKMVKAQG